MLAHIDVQYGPATVTAQVAIFTSSCAVLAADSAVTIANGTGDAARVYNGVEKIHPLSRTAPIAALVFGAADIAGVPWGTLLHACCSENDFSDLDLIDATARVELFVQDRLAGHLDDSGAKLREQRARTLLRALGEEAAVRMHEQLEDDASDDDRAKAWLENMVQAVAREHEAWREMPEVNSVAIAEESEEEIHAPHADWAKGLAAELFADLPVPIGDDLIDDTAELVLLWFTRRVPPGVETSWAGGLVVAGFGAKSFWPSHMVLEFDGIGLNGVRMWMSGHSETSGPNDASVHAFAQKSGVSTLMEGVHPTLRNMLGSAMEDAGIGNADELLQRVQRQWFDERTTGILFTLDLMPVPALCEIAESLVALTALEHRLTGSLETVGGTISVAVLAPGDPLRWAKRPILMSN